MLVAMIIGFLVIINLRSQHVAMNVKRWNFERKSIFKLKKMSFSNFRVKMLCVTEPKQNSAGFNTLERPKNNSSYWYQKSFNVISKYILHKELNI